MAGLSRQKQKLLTMKQYFEQKTDDEHSITGNRLIEILGQYGIKARHRNLVVAIVPGVIKYRIPFDDKLYEASVSEGMVRIEDGDVLMLVNTAERPEEIDAERSRLRAEEAREIMLQKRSMQEYYSAEATLRRAMVRLRVSKDQSIN